MYWLLIIIKILIFIFSLRKKKKNNFPRLKLLIIIQNLNLTDYEQHVFKSNYIKVSFTENWTDMQRTTKYFKFHPWWLVGPLEVNTSNLLFLNDYKIKFKGVFRNNSIENTLKSK